MSAHVRARWLVSPAFDLTFFIGSCVVTWLFLGLYHGLGALGWDLHGESLLLTYFVYTAVFDHPHIFQTFARTHADPVERSRHLLQHSVGLAIFIAAGLGLYAIGLWGEVIVAAAIWGSFHIVRQHWGFVKLYQRLNDDLAPLDQRLDAAIFGLGMAAFLLHDYGGVSHESWTTPTQIWQSTMVHFPAIPAWPSRALLVLFWTTAALYVARQLWKLSRGQPLNGPKLLLLLAALGTHGLVFFFTATPFLIAEALETSYHNVQYQGWSLTYQRRRFGTRRWALRWLSGALAYGLLVGVVEVVGLLEGGAWSWVFVPFAMVVMWHYWVDGRIWRMRQAPELRRSMLGSLPLGEPTGTPTLERTRTAGGT